MDPRRRLTLAVALSAAAGLPACAGLRDAGQVAPDPVITDLTPVAAPAPMMAPLGAAPDVLRVALAARGARPSAQRAASRSPAPPTPHAPSEPLTGRRAIQAANLQAREASRADAFSGGVQVFDYAPGRVFEVWTAPLRVTTLTLEPGETVLAKAAGDTVRWQIAETASGEGAERRSHVLLKPLERGLETNLVLTTNRRVYQLALFSGAPDGFNAAVAWRVTADIEAPQISAADAEAAPSRTIDPRYRILPQGRAPRWTPRSVYNDGARTFILFDPEILVEEAPALFLLDETGARETVNYRQHGALYVVDRLFDRGELSLGGRRPRAVRIERMTGGRP